MDNLKDYSSNQLLLPSQIDIEYDDFVASFEKQLGKVDLDLALKTLYLERQLSRPEDKPKVELFVCYNEGVDLEKKKYELSEFLPCLSTTSFSQNPNLPNCERIIKIECLTDLKTIHELSQDDDIEHIHGTASLGSY